MPLTRLGYQVLDDHINHRLDIVRMCPVCGFMIVQKMTSRLKHHVVSAALKVHSNIPIETCPFHPDATLMEGYIDRERKKIL